MSLDNIKDITTTARNNLVNAIRTKGVSIADDSTINQCANAITLITGGGSVGGMKFYKCASVDTDNKTWSGYELVLQDGVYVVSDTLTEDLAYTGFKPVVGKVYSEDGFIEVKDYYTGLLLVSPTYMTSNENEDWTIDASSWRYVPYNAFNGSDTETYGWESGDYQSLPQWIQWSNKRVKTKVLNYSLQVNGHTGDYNTERSPSSWLLQGSNNGSDWTTVDERLDVFTDPIQLVTHKYYNFECQNPEFYTYYRIYVTKTANGNTGGGYVYIGQIKAYGQFE